jgi:hypothetical protein
VARRHRRLLARVVATITATAAATRQTAPAGAGATMGASIADPAPSLWIPDRESVGRAELRFLPINPRS